MSITQQQQTEKAYKKSTLNVAMTGRGGAAFFTEPNSPTVVLSTNIIGSPELIPVNAPSNPVSGTKYNSAGIVTTDTDAIIQYNEVVMSAYPGSNNDSYRISSFIGIILPFNYGNGTYGPKIYSNNLSGANIPFGQNSWEFDTSSGIVTFFDGKPSSITTNTIGIKYWSYVGPTSAAGTIAQTSTYVLDISTPPANCTWSASTESWTIVNPYSTANLQAQLLINDQQCSDHVQITSSTITIKVQGVINKSTSVATYPSSVILNLTK